MDNNRASIELVKERTDIINVVGKYVKLKQAGKNFSGLCPFHNEKTPSFNVSPQLQIYKCFGCGKSGDIFSFLQEVERIDFPQALEKLAKDAGVTLTQVNANVSPAMQINQWAKVFFQKALYAPDNIKVLEYIKKRGIDDKMIKSFGVGFAPGDGTFLRRLKGYKNYSSKILVDSGIFVEKNGIIKEKFNKRIMFPVFNISGKIVAFTGRLLPEAKFGPKYLNTPETSIYQKRFTLYGLYQAKASIRKEDICLVVEGNTDVIALHKVGITHTVAAMGTGLTREQLDILSKYTRNILFVFDNDTAGQAALERSFRLTLELGLDAFAINTGKYKDVDEMIQSEPDKLISLIQQPKDAFSYLIASKAQKLDLTQLKNITFLEGYIKTFINTVSNETTKNFFLQQAKSLLGRGVFTQNTTNFNSTERDRAIYKRATPNIEDFYFKALLEQPEIQPHEDITEKFFQKKPLKELFHHITSIKTKTLNELYISLEKFPILKDTLENLLLLNVDADDFEGLHKRLLKKHLEADLGQRVRMLLAASEEKEDTSQANDPIKTAMESIDKLRPLKK
ncbi:DNA primase [bacterium]|nr:DNA primase [bacterium]